MAIEKPVPLPNDGLLHGAGFAIRVLARVIDGLYGIAVGFVGGFVAGIALVLLARMGLVPAGWQQRLSGTNLYGWGLGLVGSLLYHTLTEGMYGASLGKLICRLRVVREDGGEAGLTQAFRRSLAYFWDSIFFGLVGYSSMKKSDQNQRYGDHWAKTIVARVVDLPAGERSGWEIFVLAFLMGSVLWAFMLALGVILYVR